MLIHVGFEMVYRCPEPTPMILALNIHYSRSSDLSAPDHLLTVPSVPVTAYRDLFSNWCSRLLAPPGRFQISTNAFVLGSRLPEATLVYLLGSRYCETDQLSDIAWQRFGNGPTGWARMQAICDFVHGHIEFGYHHARRTHRVGGLPRRHWRVPGLRALGDCAVPLHEHPGALLHRLLG